MLNTYMIYGGGKMLSALQGASESAVLASFARLYRNGVQDGLTARIMSQEEIHADRD